MTDSNDNTIAPELHKVFDLINEYLFKNKDKHMFYKMKNIKFMEKSLRIWSREMEDRRCYAYSDEKEKELDQEFHQQEVNDLLASMLGV